MSEVAWTEIENALWTWVQASSGLAQSQVVWGYFKAPRPAAPFVELDVTEVDAIGEDWRVFDDAPDPAPGADLRVRHQGHRQVKLTIQAYGNTDAGDTAWPILSAVASALPIYENDIDAAGAGIGDLDPIRTNQGRKGGVLEPRSEWGLMLHVMSELESRTTYIERVSLTVNVDGLPPIALTIP